MLRRQSMGTMTPHDTQSGAIYPPAGADWIQGRRQASHPQPRQRPAHLPEAWVLGDLDLVRPLHLAGIPCAVLSPPGNPSRYTRHARSVGWADPWNAEETLLDLLRTSADSVQERPVLFYQLDAYTSFIARNRDELARSFDFVLPDRELLEDCLDKARFLALAERLGLPVPATRVLTPAGAPPKDIGLAYPIVLKPPIHGNRGWSIVEPKRKAVYVDSPGRLAELWPRLVARRGDLLAQQLVPGPETRIESYHAYRREDGRIDGEFTGRKIRTHPIQHGHTTALTVTEIPDVREMGRDIITRLRLTGVVKLDLKRAPDGRLWLLEANPRFNLWHHAAAHTGVNLPARVWSDLTGLPAPRTMRPREQAFWMSPRDIQAAHEWAVPFREWLVWAQRCEAKSVGTWDDPMPLIRLGLNRARRVLLRH